MQLRIGYMMVNIELGEICINQEISGGRTMSLRGLTIELITLLCYGGTQDLSRWYCATVVPEKFVGLLSAGVNINCTVVHRKLQLNS